MRGEDADGTGWRRPWPAVCSVANPPTGWPALPEDAGHLIILAALLFPTNGMFAVHVHTDSSL